ncbi:MAG: MGMT family protein [Anaerolineales bacterium]|nr:MGMT family protein [Anaerolineales bacterium]
MDHGFIVHGPSSIVRKVTMRFSSPPNQQAYYEQVWQLVRQIPRGRVATYGQIALMIPPPVGVEFDSYKAFSPRWVGGAMAACPDDVPWQRVINSQGRISARPGAARQRELLEEEGVEFVKDKIDLKKYGWKGLGEEDEPKQETLF